MLQASTPWGELGLASHHACSPWMTCVHMYLGETPHTTQGTRLRIGSPRVSSAHAAAAAGRLHGCGRCAARARAGGRRLRDWRPHRRRQPLCPAGAAPRPAPGPPLLCRSAGASGAPPGAGIHAQRWQKRLLCTESDNQPYMAEMRERPVQGLAEPAARHAYTIVLVRLLILPVLHVPDLQLP